MEPIAEETPFAIWLEASAFTPEDAEATLARWEPELPVETGIVNYYFPDGPPDVALEILESALPLADVYVGLLSAAIYDLLKMFAKNTGEPETEAKLMISTVDEDGNELRSFIGNTTDPEIAERWLRMLNEGSGD